MFKKTNRWWVILGLLLLATAGWYILPTRGPVIRHNGLIEVKNCDFPNQVRFSKMIDTGYTILLQAGEGAPPAFGDIYRVKFAENTIWVLAGRNNLFAFQLDGRLIGQVNQRKDGPGGILQISDFEVVGNEIYILEASKSYLQVFRRQDFAFLRTVPLSLEESYTELTHWNKQWYFYSPSAFSDYQLHVYNAQFQLLAKLLPHDVKIKNVILSPSRPLTKLPSSVVLQSTFNDTIRRITPANEIAPALVVAPCKSKLTQRDKLRMEAASQEEAFKFFEEHSILHSLQENDAFYWIATFEKGLTSQEVLISKKTGKYRKVDNHYEEEDLRLYQPLDFRTTYGDFFVAPYNEDDLQNYVKKHKISKLPLGALSFVKFKPF